MEPESSLPAGGLDPAGLLVGKPVVIRGLVGAPELNGRTGVVLRLAADGRLAVALDGAEQQPARTVAVRRECVEPSWGDDDDDDDDDGDGYDAARVDLSEEEKLRVLADIGLDDDERARALLAE